MSRRNNIYAEIAKTREKLISITLQHAQIFPVLTSLEHGKVRDAGDPQAHLLLLITTMFTLRRLQDELMETLND